MKPWIGAAALVALLGAFAAGRYTAADPEVVEVERVTYRDRVVTVTKVERQEARSRVVYRHITPDAGTFEVEREATKIVENVRGTSERDASGTKQRDVKITPYRASGRVGILAGGRLHFPNDGALQIDPVFGATAEARVLGPFWFGAWATHTGILGLSLSAEF